MAAVDSFDLLYREVSRSCGTYSETLALVGALYASSRALYLLRDGCAMVRVHFLPRMIQTTRLTQIYGGWAVVNGATESVAKAYAEELAKQGVSVIFICHDGAGVGDLAARLAQDYGVETVVVLAHFSLDPAAVEPVQEALRGKDVGFLVNCVDESLASPHAFTDIPEQRVLDLVTKNIGVATLLARLVLPSMLRRGRGAVVNISSGACCRPLPGRVTLTACTGFLDQLSRSLHFEYSGRGLVIQSLIPFQVATPSSPLAESWLVPKPDVYARHAISTLGVSHRTTGYWPHTLQRGLLRCVPDWIWVLGSRVLVRSGGS
ncbi:inactive hydroxysteroid dehydrogenase-like protein 1 [Synchiropus splendidus]|uniref:inactive hydroxysteroid dehydrogenase-like protein 1 n=1 Tax=Synchiropus splendidus TaxID=270530 RepID=UPI00237EB6A1|nr:inactive hydroxysteroid dehydrogenase-like protein 1 [Synchiropus splendidus]